MEDVDWKAMSCDELARALKFMRREYQKLGVILKRLDELTAERQQKSDQINLFDKE